MELKENGDFIVPVAGHSKELTAAPVLSVTTGICWCGSIRDGVAFRFEGEGCWVIALDTLREIVAAAEHERSNVELTGDRKQSKPAVGRPR